MGRITDDLYIDGTLGAKNFSPPAGSISDSAILAGAGIDSKKVKQEFNPCIRQAGTATTETQCLYVVYGATATIEAFKCGLRTACTSTATVVVDLKKNGSSILTATVTLSSSTAAFAKVAGTLSSATLVAGDVLEVSITATAGGGAVGTGFFAHAVIREDPQ